jgi:hypothetical protein
MSSRQAECILWPLVEVADNLMEEDTVADANSSLHEGAQRRIKHSVKLTVLPESGGTKHGRLHNDKLIGRILVHNMPQ